MANEIEPKESIQSLEMTDGRAGNNNIISYQLNGDGTGTVALATGSAISRYDSPYTYNTFDKTIFQSDGIPSNFHDLIPVMRSYYESDGLFGSVIDLMVQFTVDDRIENVTDDPEIEEFFDAIVETSNLMQAVRWIALEYHLLQNVFPFRSELGGKVTARNRKKVPHYNWTVLNPQFVEVSGSLLLGKPKIKLKPNDDLINFVNSKDFTNEMLPLPPKMIEQIRRGEPIELDQDRVYHIARNKQPFQRYAPVAFRRLIKPMRIKEKYMQMDLSTADGIINQVVLFKLGNDQYPVTDDETLRKFAKLLQTPGKAYQLVWNHAIDVEIIRADADALNPAKYEPIDREIMWGFSVPQSLLGGYDSSSSYSKDWMAVRGIIERLKWCREDIEAWIEREYRIIARENKLKTWPKPRLGVIKLEEERAFKQILMNLYDRNILSAQTVLAETGYEYVTEIERLREEQRIREEEGILIPRSPYQQSKDGWSRPVVSPGRPDGTTEDEPRDGRTPTPRPSGSGQGKRGSLDVPTDEHSLHIAMADSRFEEKSEELYLAELEYLYDETRDSILRAVDTEADSTRRYEEVLAILAAFRDKMADIGNRYMDEMFDYQYGNIERTFTDDFEHSKAYNNLVRWHGTYVDKLYFDLERGVVAALERDSIQAIKFFVDAVFDKEKYRLPHFAREGIRRAKFVGATTAHVEMGYRYGLWKCSFRNSCKVCIDRHGKTFRIEDLWDLYPAHNRCECSITFLMTSGEAVVASVETSGEDNSCSCDEH